MEVLLFQPPLETKKGFSFAAISQGLIALGLYLQKHGVDVKIVHFNGSKTNLKKRVEEKINEYRPRYVGINLNWHVHCASALKIAEKTKQVDDSIKTVFGGFTASVFDKEIFSYLENKSSLEKKKPFVDVIIRGDGERPFLDFVKSGKIPRENTTFVSDNGKKIRHSLGYVQERIPDVGFGSAIDEFIDDWKSYVLRKGLRTAIMGKEETTSHNSWRGEFHLNIGKGCPNNCCYCGGGRDIQKRIFGRTKCLFRSVDRVNQDIIWLAENGVKTVYLDFDPDPGRNFYHTLFSEMDKSNLNLIFSAWSGPLDDHLLGRMNRIFEGVEVVISPESGSERQRRLLLRRGYGKPYYPNDKLVEFFKKLDSYGNKAMCYFISGLPWGTKEDFNKTLILGAYLASKFPSLFLKEYDARISGNLCAPPLYVEPGCPISRAPDVFGMKVYRKTFEDYLKNCINDNSSPLLGAHNSRNVGEEEVIDSSTRFREVVEGCSSSSRI
ncbi:MAG: cobalamin-dependent protein [Candidatus Altiarchaeota archaeon]